MPYKRYRPASTHGNDPVPVFRVIDSKPQPLHQQPRQYAKSQQLFQQLAASPDPDAVAMTAIGPGDAGTVVHLAKLWSELVYEQVRAARFPEMVSRLDCVFGFTDIVEAFAFVGVGSGTRVFRGTTASGIPWSVTDMSKYHSAQISPGQTFSSIRPTVEAQAAAYWSADRPISRAEVLVGGAIDLEVQIDLVDLYEAMGLVDSG
jgi:hypothetical protein